MNVTSNTETLIRPIKQMCNKIRWTVSQPYVKRLQGGCCYVSLVGLLVG